ncbi:MAG: hypothetical protein FD189_1415 [Elusimicrobia bacterium]|nr:MAG: hypothetical protein FD154_2528 [Elusimicrobiota bacterium]KAF0155499.1 MAG: hypothetical protein FD189_1415 [Elusimicrobiota bacterium]
MNKNDRIIAAFLVSLGVFSSGVATQYVRSLTPDQKIVLLQASDTAGTAVPVDNTNTLPVPARK